MKFKRPAREEDVSINLVSLIDVLFILIIFFMVSTTFVERAELVTLVSQAGESQSAARYLLRTKALFLEVQLPPDSKLSSAYLDGAPILPQHEKQSLLLSLPAAAGEDQPRRPDHIQVDLAGHAFVKRSAFFDMDIAHQAHPQELVGRELSSPLAHTHHDAIDIFARDCDVCACVQHLLAELDGTWWCPLEHAAWPRPVPF